MPMPLKERTKENWGMGSMFDNIGGKIKTLAHVTCILGMIASVCGAVAIWMRNGWYTPTILAGALVLGVGCLGSWIGSFFTYGFGQLIESVEDIHADNWEILQMLNMQSEDYTNPTAETVSSMQYGSEYDYGFAESNASDEEWK